MNFNKTETQILTTLYRSDMSEKNFDLTEGGKVRFWNALDKLELSDFVFNQEGFTHITDAGIEAYEDFILPKLVEQAHEEAILIEAERVQKERQEAERKQRNMERRNRQRMARYSFLTYMRQDRVLAEARRELPSDIRVRYDVQGASWPREAGYDVTVTTTSAQGMPRMTIYNSKEVSFSSGSFASSAEADEFMKLMTFMREALRVTQEWTEMTVEQGWEGWL